MYALSRVVLEIHMEVHEINIDNKCIIAYKGESDLMLKMLKFRDEVMKTQARQERNDSKEDIHCSPCHTNHVSSLRTN